jgi:hypothetical protein
MLLSRVAQQPVSVFYACAGPLTAKGGIDAESIERLDAEKSDACPQKCLKVRPQVGRPLSKIVVNTSRAFGTDLCRAEDTHHCE